MPSKSNRHRTVPNPSREMYEVEEIVAALIQAGGIVRKTAEILGTSISTVDQYLAKYPELREARRAAKEEMLDRAEENVQNGIMDDDKTYTIFFLKTQGKKRGWSERIEITGDEGSPVAARIDLSAMPPSELKKLLDAARKATAK